MAEAKGFKKNQRQPSRIKAALKANNEIYYQMASIFKQISHDKGKSAQRILNKYLPGQSSEIFLEKSF